MNEIGRDAFLILLLIALNGVLAMSEIAVVSARKARLRQRAEDGDAGAATALQLSDEPTRFLSTVQIGITLVGIFAGAFGGATIAEKIGDLLSDVPALAAYGDAIGLAVVVATITYLSLILGELVPKRIGLNHAERVAVVMSRPMLWLSHAAGPLVTLLTLSTDAVLRLIQLRPSADAGVTEDEVKFMLAEGAETGVFEEAEREIVESVFELTDRRVAELMVPRPRMVWLDLEDPPETNWQVIASSSYSHYPVARGDLDQLVGLVASKQLLGAFLAGGQPDLEAMVVQPTFVPETMTALRLLDQLKTAHPRVAVVVDEHGIIAGLVTPTDILEAIVGELPEPGDAPDPAAVQREDGTWLVDGLLLVDELDELFGVGELSDDERGAFRTVGGLVMRELNRVPSAGDTIVWRGLRVEVIDMDGRRVDKVLISPPATPGPPEP
ncbi:MAG: HlyC/CorC family transporter [Chloroflexi bacterium]|nr:HlyC/CorC family transporter [Chloroflexota bacterium]